MRYLPLSAIALSALLLTACGGSLEGGEGTDPTPTPEPTGEPTPTPEPNVPLPAEPGVPASFVYIGATPSWIAVKGTGGAGRQESSLVGFKLIDRNGEAVENVDVDFSLVAPAGTSIDPSTGTTNADGIVSTTVLSGTVSGPVRVNVTTDSGITTVSDSLSVSTGLPDQDSISLSFSTNAPEALKIDGVTSAITIRLADKYNNAVPDGTMIYFTTEGGAIRDEATGTHGSCLTVASKCSLVWESQNPRPKGNELHQFKNGCAAWAYGERVDFGPCINAGGMGRPYGGRATITAYTLGEEIFVDNDADGWFTAGDDFFAKNNLSEVFYDHNEDGFYKEESSAINIGDEEEGYADLSPQDGVYSDGSESDYNKYNGLLCALESEKAGLCSRKPVYVRASGVMTMAASVPYIRVQNGGIDTGSIDLRGTNAQQDLTVYLAGIYNNAPPSGTTVVVSTDNGELSGPTDWLIGGASSNIDGVLPFLFTFTITQEESPNKKTSGKLSIVITTPGGNGIASTITTYTMNVYDDAPPEATP
ncbi:Ig-like domain-containing protein [Psychromonas hadalis]|uniref:Ig-like domain-containing protein n=1 Tax=Psychromonas hadalis TaxID=211669 RepID=UPI0003B78778|nr:Ig-like domain-containing protein [Psychromonas hadalis]